MTDLRVPAMCAGQNRHGPVNSPRVRRSADGVRDGVEPALTARLLLACSERRAPFRALDALLSLRRVEVASAERSTHADGLLCLRLELSLPVGMSVAELDAVMRASVGAHQGMTWQVSGSDRPKRCAVLVSKADHCLIELLHRWSRRQLAGDVVLVASNHPDLRHTCEGFGMPFYHMPVDPGRRRESEVRLAELLHGACDVLVLARYMQVLSGEFIEEIGTPVINIHHSLLPAFVGARPYERAKERGVKVIGATAHYVTEGVDEGPIIEQDVVRVSHRDDLKALKRLGADVERMVLARAVNWHCEDRLLRKDADVVVFDGQAVIAQPRGAGISRPGEREHV